MGMELLHCNNNYGSAARAKCEQNGEDAGMSKAKTSRHSSIRRRPVFPAPDHDHDRCSSDAMAVAEMLCVQRGQRLTPIRRKVLAALLDTHKPLGAYGIIERLVIKGPGPATITAYHAVGCTGQ